MTIYNFGDVIVANVPFAQQNVKKPRPAVVVSNARYYQGRSDIIIASITSNLEVQRELNEFTIQDLSGTGLRHASRVKAFIATIDPQIVKYGIGKLSEADILKLRLMLCTLFECRE